MDMLSIIQQIYGLGSQVLFVVFVLVALMPSRYLLKKRVLAVGITIVAGLTILPFSHTSIAEILRGFFGDFSITTVVLMMAAIVKTVWRSEWFSEVDTTLLKWLVFVGMVVLYPFSGGIGQIDPYIWGYQPTFFLGLIGILALFFFVRGSRLAWLCLLILLSFAVQVMESNNLWDYLMDFWIVLFFTTQIFVLFYTKGRRKWLKGRSQRKV